MWALGVDLTGKIEESGTATRWFVGVGSQRQRPK